MIRESSPLPPGKMRRRRSANPGYRLDSNRIQRTSGWISDLRCLRALIPACSRSLFNGGTPGKRADQAYSKERQKPLHAINRVVGDKSHLLVSSRNRADNIKASTGASKVRMNKGILQCSTTNIALGVG